jgi:N-acetylmuramoyl-L-alanine amidase
MNEMRVVKDPGHGGKDCGAVGASGLHEADVNLSVALMVADRLRPFMDVVMTRSTDEFIDLSPRAEIANNVGANAFLSIHCNSVDDSSAHGTETFSFPGAVNGKKLATVVHKHVVDALGLTDRGLKEANFAVLRETNMAACLVELAFISNHDEEKLLASKATQRKVANAIADGIAEYFGVTLPPLTPRIVVGDLSFDALVVDGVTYAPVRALAEALGKQVDWVESEQTVYIR